MYLVGYPRASVLGPLLFIMFVNDLPDEVKSSRTQHGDPSGTRTPAWVIFKKKFLSLVLKEKNNLALRRVKKNNLSLKTAKKITWPGLRKNKKISWLTIKEKPPFYFIFVMCRWLLGGDSPPDHPYIYKKSCSTLVTISTPYLYDFI